MARWQLYTGLRVSELLRLTIHDILKHKTVRRSQVAATHHTIRLIRKGRKQGYVIASESLLLRQTPTSSCIVRRGFIARSVAPPAKPSLSYL